IAVAGGPYSVCEAASPITSTLVLNGSTSIGRGSNIVSYEWDFTSPVNFSSVDATGAVTDQTTYFRGLAVGAYDVALRVTDDSDSHFQSSSFTTVTVKSKDVAECKPVQAVATATDGGGVYNGSAFTGSGSCSNGLTPVISYTPGPAAPVDAGTTSFTVTCGDGGHNY